MLRNSQYLSIYQLLLLAFPEAQLTSPLKKSRKHCKFLKDIPQRYLEQRQLAEVSTGISNLCQKGFKDRSTYFRDASKPIVISKKV